MSRSKGSVVVTRTYIAAPDDCVRALELLLNKSVRKEAARPGGPNHGTESKEDSAYGHIIQDPA
jgi:hypothetical protein